MPRDFRPPGRRAAPSTYKITPRAQSAVVNRQTYTHRERKIMTDSSVCREASTPKRKLEISFGGCGFLGVYHVGVGKRVVDHVYTHI